MPPPKVEIHSAIMFRCPRCQHLNLQRYIEQSAASDPQPITDPKIIAWLKSKPDDELCQKWLAEGIRIGGSITRPIGWEFCRKCGYDLDECERGNGWRYGANDPSPGDGLVFPAWFFICDHCGRENFITETTYDFENNSIGRGGEDGFHCENCRMYFHALSEYDDPDQTFIEGQDWIRRCEAAKKELREKYGFDC